MKGETRMALQYILRFMDVEDYGKIPTYYSDDEGEYIKELNYTTYELTDFANAKRFTWDELFSGIEIKALLGKEEMEDLSSYEKWLSDRKRRENIKFVLELREQYKGYTKHTGYYLIENLKYDTIIGKMGLKNLLTYSKLMEKLDTQYYSIDTYQWLKLNEGSRQFEKLASEYHQMNKI